LNIPTNNNHSGMPGRMLHADGGGVNYLFSEPEGPNQSIFIEYFTILRRRKMMIILTFLLVFIPVMFWTFTTKPIYEAEAVIIYEEPQDTMIALDIGQAFYNKSAIMNLTEQLRSRTISMEVAQRLPEQIFELYELSETKSDSIWRYRLLSEILRENLSVSGVRGSDILQLRMRAPDPIAAQTITNTYVEIVISWNLHKKRSEITSIHDFIEKQLSDFHTKLDSTEGALRSYKEQNNMFSLSEASTNVLARLTEADIAYNQTKAEREAMEQRMLAIERKKQEIAPVRSVGSNPELQPLKNKLLDLEMQYSRRQAQGAKQTDPELAQLRGEIDQIKQELVQKILNISVRDNLIDPLSQSRTLLQESITLDIELETCKARENGLKKIVDDYNQELRTLPKQELELARLIRDKEVNDKIYSMLLERREETRITKAGKIGDIRVIDGAEIPLEPVAPNKKKNLMLGIVLGLSFGIGLAFFLESLDTSVKSEEDVEKLLGLPVLAQIPNINTNGEIHLGRARHSKEFYTQKLLPSFVNIPHLYEAHRNLQLNFAFVNLSQNLKAILFTSAGAGDGKTLNSVNMAYLFARLGTKTLIIDCDLRRPMIHKILGFKQEPGLSQVLIQETPFEAAVRHLDADNLDVLTCGTLPPNPSDLLNAPQMEQLIRKLKSQYDLIILDAPPVIAVTDSIVLSSKVDGICLVVRANKTRRDAVKRAKELLQKGGSKIIGLILNDVNIKNLYGYSKDYYYYSNASKQHA